MSCVYEKVKGLELAAKLDRNFAVTIAMSVVRGVILLLHSWYPFKPLKWINIICGTVVQGITTWDFMLEKHLQIMVVSKANSAIYS